MQISPIGQQEYRTKFAALKKVQCLRNVNYGDLCSTFDKRVMDELKELAKVNDFFKNNDVKAIVSVVSASGARIVMSSKPVAKTFVDKIKNLLLSPEVWIISDDHICPCDSSYYIAKKLREVKDGKQDISSIMSK